MKDERQRFDRGRYRQFSLATATGRFSLLLLVAAVTGCTGLRLDPDISDAVRIERIDSPQARIASVQVRDHGGQLEVSGRLQKRYRGRSPIAGHLHIEARAEDGAVLGQAVASYRQLSPKMGISEFARQLPVPPAQVRSIRVLHHHRDDGEPHPAESLPSDSSTKARPSSEPA